MFGYKVFIAQASGATSPMDVPITLTSASWLEAGRATELSVIAHVAEAAYRVSVRKCLGGQIEIGAILYDHRDAHHDQDDS